MGRGLAEARTHFESLVLRGSYLKDDAVMTKLVPDGQVNRSLTHLDLRSNGIVADLDAEHVIAFASRCTNLDRHCIRVSLHKPGSSRLEHWLTSSPTTPLKHALGSKTAMERRQGTGRFILFHSVSIRRESPTS
jgi:hypothetical protein